MNDFDSEKLDKGLMIFVIALAIFIFGVQVGIKHGRDLQIQEFQETNAFSSSN